MNRPGRRAEDLAAEHLAQAGLRLLARNWRTRHGELDLVAREGQTVVFAEVRLRRASGRFGGAIESVGRTKRARLIAAAQAYLAAHGEAPCRFDLVLLDALDAARVQWIRDAFRP